MPANMEWGVEHRLVSPEGTLELNTPGPVLTSGLFPLFLITPPYSIVPSKLRTVADDVSQADGESLQPPFIGGMVATFKVTYWVQPTWDSLEERRSLACAGDLREMDERLMLHVNALREFSSNPASLQRLEWVPSGASDRMLSDILVAVWPAPDFPGGDLGGVGAEVTLAVATPFPYAADVDAVVTEIADASSGVVVNGGTAKVSPVMRAHGPSTVFAITNERTAEVFSYDSGRPGGAGILSGHYAEIDFFKGSVLLDGIDDEAHNLIAGVDPGFTDFFRLLPGSQTIDAAGAAVTVIASGAYV